MCAGDATNYALFTDFFPPTFTAAETAQIDVLVEKGTNESIALQWTSTAPEQLFSVTLEQGNSKNEAQTKETKADSDKKCIVEVRLSSFSLLRAVYLFLKKFHCYQKAFEIN